MRVLYSLTRGLLLLVGAPKQQVAAFHVEDGSSPVEYGAVHPPPHPDHPTSPVVSVWSSSSHSYR